MFFSLSSAPAGTTEFTVSFSAQLSDGAQWKVDMYDFGAADDWTPIGDLSDVETSAWTSKDIRVTQPSGSDFIETASLEMLLRVYATSTQTGYIDYVSIAAGASSPTPQPAVAPTAPPSTSQPVAGPTAPPTTPQPVVAPTAPPATPQPATAPTPGSTGTAGVVEFVEVVEGAAILAEQVGGVPLTVRKHYCLRDLCVFVVFSQNCAKIQ